MENLKSEQIIEEKEEGASLVEYALLVALIAVVCIAGMQLLGQAVSTKFSQVGSSVTAN